MEGKTKGELAGDRRVNQKKKGKRVRVVKRT